MFKKGLFILVLPLLLLVSFCSEYQRLLKSSDYNLKYEKAVQYFDNEEYAKALPLLEELKSVFKGNEKGEKVYYYYAKCYFADEDYILASYHLKNFARTFPNSPDAEEALFLCAMSFYFDSPKYSLDQSNTILAIQEFQLFINSFPESKHVQECNTYIDKLRYKLESKSFETARLYFHMENHKAAIVALTNTLKDFPSTQYKEEILYMILQSNYLLATNSIETKKMERYGNTITAYYKYIDFFPQGKYVKEAKNYFDRANKMFEYQSFELGNSYFESKKYEAALSAFNNTLKNFPATTYKEEILFLTLRSYYYLATNGPESKRLDYSKNAIKAYNDYLGNFPSGKYLKEVNDIFVKLGK